MPDEREHEDENEVHTESLRDHGDEWGHQIERAIGRIVDAKLDAFRRELAAERDREAEQFVAAWKRETAALKAEG
jgi:hypothetical protein